MRFLLVLFALTAACAQGSPDGAMHSDWPHYGGTQLSWRYSALDQVNTGNVKDLVPRGGSTLVVFAWPEASK